MSKEKFSLPPVSPLMGTTINNFIKIVSGNAIKPKYFLKIFLTAFIVVVLTPFRWYENLIFQRKLSRTKIVKPIFILGHWRSGTTFLHNLMCEDPNSGFVSTYQTVFPNHMASKWLFGAFMGRVMPDKRPSDNVKLSMEFPQEEEFGFLNMNPHSFYNYFYFPSRYKEYYDQAIHLTGLKESERKQIRKDYLTLLRKAQIVTGKSLLVIKNPINTARIKFIKTLFPEARFVHLMRNPYTVFLSSKKFFTSLLPTLWFHEVSDEEISDMVIELYAKLYSDYFAEFNSANIVELKFEDLEKEPLSSLGKLYWDLNIPGFEAAKPFFESYLDKQKNYKKNTYYITKTEVQKIQSNWGFFIKKWGYEFPQNMKIV